MLAAEQICLINSNATISVVSSIEATSKPKSLESFSNFGDGDCGEPRPAQHLLIDFTPDETIDNDFVQKKACAFWKFVHNTPALRSLIALPESHEPSTADGVSEEQEPISEPDHVTDVGKTAVDMLKFVEDKGLIDRTFEAKMAQTGCSLGSREYNENGRKAQNKKKQKPCKCIKICKPCPDHMKTKHSVEDTPAQILCKKLDAWDAKHPKSMEPPSHPPPLQHAVMQRQVFQ